jgi:alpha-mannosidase
MNMNLLRAPKAPDPRADRGIHHFSYAIMPHGGSWQEADIPSMAADFAFGAMVMPGYAADTDPAITVSDTDPERSNHFVVDTIKPAEEGTAIILRGHESKGSRGTVRIRPAFMRIRKAYICNLLEENTRAVKVGKDNTLSVRYAPYQLITLKLLGTAAKR